MTNTSGLKVVPTVAQCQMKYDASNYLILMQFEGDIGDNDYRDFWVKCVEFVEQNDVWRVIVDQSKIGNVGFKARGWVIINVLPRVNKAIGKKLVGGIISSKNVIHKSGMQYMMLAFQKIVGRKIKIYESQEEAINDVRGLAAFDS